MLGIWLWLKIKQEGYAGFGPFFRLPGIHFGTAIWVWVEMKPPGYGPQVLVLGSIYKGFILGTYF